MKERNDNSVVVAMKPNDNVLAYCPDCRTVVFHGDDETNLKRKILRSRVLSHMSDRSVKHDVDVIYPRKSERSRIIAGKKFIATGDLRNT